MLTIKTSHQQKYTVTTINSTNYKHNSEVRTFKWTNTKYTKVNYARASQYEKSGWADPPQTQNRFTVKVMQVETVSAQ